MSGTTARQEAEEILAELPDRISDVIKPFAQQSPNHPALVQDDVTGPMAIWYPLSPGQRSLWRITAYGPATGS